jgi:hypothetical protein
MKHALYVIGLAASVSLLIPAVFILILWASQ